MAEIVTSGAGGKRASKITRVIRSRYFIGAVVLALLIAATSVAAVHMSDQRKTAEKTQMLLQETGKVTPATIARDNLADNTDTASKIQNLQYLGAEALDAGQDAKAIDYYNQAWRLDGNNVMTAVNLMEAYAKQKDAADATKYGNEAVRIMTANPTDPYSSNLPYYRNWLANIAGDNFDPPKVEREAELN